MANSWYSSIERIHAENTRETCLLVCVVKESVIPVRDRYAITDPIVVGLFHRIAPAANYVHYGGEWGYVV